MTDLEKNEAVVAVTGEVDSLAQYTANYAITTAEQFVAGSDDLKRVKAAQKKLEDTRTSITGPMNAALKKVNDFFRAPADTLLTIERKIKAALGAYTEEQERIRREEQRRADEEAAKQRAKLEAQAKKAAESGKGEKAAALEQRAQTVVAPVIQREPPKVTGISYRDAWKFEVTDPALIPREYLMVDESKIRKVVQALKGDTQIPGVRVYSEKQIAAGAA